MTHGAQPRTRSAQGTKCEFPGCTVRASSTRKPAHITINGRPVTVERLCTDHRLHVTASTRARPTPRRTKKPRVSVAYYRCGGCNRLHANYPDAERCADTHGGARITNDVIHERHATRPECLACGTAWPCPDADL